MDPCRLQKQLKDNASELQDFCRELKEWGEEVKKNEEHRKDPRKIAEISKLKPKIKDKKVDKQVKDKPVNSGKPIDYAAWDKFDVEAECARVDKSNSDESDVSDEVDGESLDLAMQYKEKGNKCVKEKNWSKAVEYYTNAIDTYAYDPIFYANRALCFLKLQNYKKAEADCTIALKLDNSYVKAYQRRAAAREKLGLLLEAKNDLQKVLEFEPKNIESQQALEPLEKALQSQKDKEPQRPVSKFTLSRQKRNDKIEPNKSAVHNDDEIAIKKHVKENVEPKVQTVIQATIDTHNKTPIWPKIPDIKMVKPTYKLPNFRSKKPLKRINVEHVESVPELEMSLPIAIQLPIAKGDVEEKLQHKDDADKKLTASTSKQESTLVREFVYPKTAVHFSTVWQSFGNNTTLKYEYLKQIHGENLNDIFKESLDTKLFSDIIKILAEEFIANSQNVYSYLFGLTKLKRFSTLTMFMTSKDKEHITRLMDYLKTTTEVLNEKIESLMQMYNVKC